MTRAHDIISPDIHINFAELCATANISAEHMIDLIEYNVIMPIAGNAQQEWEFNTAAIETVNKAARLHRDLEIDWNDIALILNLLEEIEQLKNENRQLKQEIKNLLTFKN